jgi:hypothetical protein
MIRLDNRRSAAWSRSNGRFVAPSTSTLVPLPPEHTPSICTRNSVCRCAARDDREYSHQIQLGHHSLTHSLIVLVGWCAPCTNKPLVVASHRAHFLFAPTESSQSRQQISAMVVVRARFQTAHAPTFHYHQACVVLVVQRLLKPPQMARGAGYCVALLNKHHTHLDVSEEAEIEKKVHLASVATALASMVLPVGVASSRSSSRVRYRLEDYTVACC